MILVVCVCVRVFIKVHITAQSGPVILVILCHSHWSSSQRDQSYLIRKRLIMRDKRDTLALLSDPVSLVIICHSH